jgi:hypothetical protein
MLLMAFAVAMLIVAIRQWTQNRAGDGETNVAPRTTSVAAVKK